MTEKYLIVLVLKNFTFTMSMERQCEAFSPSCSPEQGMVSEQVGKIPGRREN